MIPKEKRKKFGEKIGQGSFIVGYIENCKGCDAALMQENLFLMLVIIIIHNKFAKIPRNTINY